MSRYVDTPRTDLAAFVATFDYESVDVVAVSFAEQLEKELIEARRVAEHYRNLHFIEKDGLAAAKNHPLSWEKNERPKQ